MFTNPVNSTVDIRQISPLFRWVWNTSQRWLNRRMSANHQQYGSLREVNLFNHGNGQIPNLHPVEVVKKKQNLSLPRCPQKIKGVLLSIGSIGGRIGYLKIEIFSWSFWGAYRPWTFWMRFGYHEWRIRWLDIKNKQRWSLSEYHIWIDRLVGGGVSINSGAQLFFHWWRAGPGIMEGISANLSGQAWFCKKVY